MSKKEQISELLQKGTDINEIIEQTNSTKSYIYRIQREIDESKGDNDNSIDGKDGDFNDLVVDSTSGIGSNVEKDDDNLEEKKNKRDTNYTGAVGGVKKKKKSVKKNKKSTKKNKKVNSEQEKVNSEQEINEQNSTLGGIKLWMKLKWKKTLLILTLLILLITAILLSLMRKSEEPMNQASQLRYPVLR